jgi:Tfp pilus assembly protein PilO
MALDLTKKIIILVSILSFLVFTIILGVFIPALNYIKKTADESYRLRMFMEQKYEQSLRLRVTKKKLDEIKNASAGFYSFLFKAGDELKLITLLESISAKHSIIQSITNSTIDKIGGSQIASISINLSGAYIDVLKYIAELEASDYFIYIKQVHIMPMYSRSGEGTQDSHVSITIELYVNQ